MRWPLINDLGEGSGGSEVHKPRNNTLRNVGKPPKQHEASLVRNVLLRHRGRMKIGREIARARKAAGRSQEWLADRVGVTQSAVSAWEGGRNEPDLATLKRVADALQAQHLSLASFSQEAFTRVMGYVGAGQEVFEADIASGELDRIEAPPKAPSGAEAVIVRGESMEPLFRAGNVLVYWDRTQPPEQLYGETCVVKVRDGGMVVKTVEKGSAPGLYDLRSHNAPTRRDIAIEWLAPVEIILRKADWRPRSI